MFKRIALFNHKGGVSKTTTTFNVGWKLAEKGKRVIIVDADPQCNLTGMVLGYRGLEEFEKFYEERPNCNIKEGLAPAFESRPSLIEPVECLPVQERDGLFLLPGHLGLSEYEVTLGISQELSGSLPALRQLPGSISYLLKKTAEKFLADYVIIDMNPSLSSINQNFLMTSDFFLVPSSPDYFSVMALESLSKVIPNWKRWADKLGGQQAVATATYPFPGSHLKFLGTVIQKYRPRGGLPSSAFQMWIDLIEKTVGSKFAPTLDKEGLMLPREMYVAEGIDANCTLATIPDFNSLIALSQESQTPVFALREEQIHRVGVVLEQTLKSRDDFDRIFSELADKIVGLTP
jgi:cellulose biosynthesis protein BcsQ